MAITPKIQKIPEAHATKGRGAASNMSGRYEIITSDAYDDGWNQQQSKENDDFSAPALVTEVFKENAKSILTRNASPDIPFNVSLNPYRGCEHGCIYCYARPSHSYLNLSPGLDFETKIFAKVNAAELLTTALAKPSYIPEAIALGVNTDMYQPCEREYKITRQVLEVLWRYRHPAYLITKNSLIERDIDLLSAMAAQKLVSTSITITTLDHDISRILEPRCSSPARRLNTVRRLSEAGVPVEVNIAPIIPFITDSELEKIIAAAAQAGAASIHYIILRLPWEVSPLFEQWLETHFPQRAERVMNRIRDMRGGKNNDSQFGSRMRGEGIWADLLQQRFRKAATQHQVYSREKGFNALDCSQFRPPSHKAALKQKVKQTAKLANKDKNDSQLNLF
ncbi:hypothetical protein TDB9533_03074 [Thalassocella blandensis]|nr:hypothetical protein TDB9533_03074 [Thalassocella blandensis]